MYAINRDNQPMSEEANVGLADEATDISSRQKDQVKRRERLCKIWELDSNNSDVYSDSFVEFDTDESSNSLRSIGILSIHICSAALSLVCSRRPATLAFISFFVFPILPNQLQEKPSCRKIISPPWVHCETQGFFGDSRKNFTAS